MAIRLCAPSIGVGLVSACLSQTSPSTPTPVRSLEDLGPPPAGAESEASSPSPGSVHRTRLPLDQLATPELQQRVLYEDRGHGQLDQPELVVDRHRPAFRQCFERAAASGRVSLQVRVDARGTVDDAVGHSTDLVPREVVHCIEQRAFAMQFTAPVGGDAHLPIAVVYLRQ